MVENRCTFFGHMRNELIFTAVKQTGGRMLPAPPDEVNKEIYCGA